MVAYDYELKQNILRKLRGEGCKVTVAPAQTLAEDVLALKPDGVFLSNGPGDPEPCNYAVDNIRRLMGRQPIFGICLGHQLTGIALGGKTFKLKFGHHGGNHPVKQLNSGKIEITAHNHNFAVDPDSLPQSEVELTHIDLNDNTLEGMRHRNLPLFCVQYHPEAWARAIWLSFFFFFFFFFSVTIARIWNGRSTNRTHSRCRATRRSTVGN